MKRVCAWCEKRLPDVEPLDDERLTHGMCEKCAKRIKEEPKWVKDDTGFIKPE